MRLLFEKIMTAILKRSKQLPQKSYETWLAKGYNDTPEVTVIIQSHNKSVQVCHILPKLRQHKNLEIIVIDDGSSLEHTQRLAKALTGANEFLVRANDLYENRTYDKAIRFANGRYIALLQDDDDFDGAEWMTAAVGYFRKYPQMAILGGKWALHLETDENRKWAHSTSHSTEGKDFVFTASVNRAPMWINRELFEAHLHHIDATFAPFQYDDDELCLRAWLSGLQVGWYNAGFRSLSAGGMRLWNNQFSKEQTARNGKLLYKMYADKAEEVERLVSAANQKYQL
ncbi:MAG: glycosyltransferase [Prevotella sp.]|nr:glycosyltransferase [Prevotella sp.]